jgi:hypothetical protein
MLECTSLSFVWGWCADLAVNQKNVWCKSDKGLNCMRDVIPLGSH